MNIKVTAKGTANLIVKRYTGPFRIRRNWLKKTQWLSSTKLRQIQFKLFKKIVSHSYRSVPYYKKIMYQYNIKPDDIKTLDDVQKFPILTKKHVLNAADSILSTDYPKWMLKHARTGGSTGTPMIIYRNPLSIPTEHAFVRRQWDWAGIGPKDRCAVFMSKFVVKPGTKNGKLYVYDPAMKELTLSTYHLGPETAKLYAYTMKRYNVKAVVGYPSAITYLANVCLDNRIELNLKAALTTSEALTPSMRKTIKLAFRCKVFDFYGSAERVCYIHTCPYGKYHILPEYGLTELIEIPGSAPRKYKIIATGFWNRAMPLIRYDTDDIVTKADKPCSCGRCSTSVDYIDGRGGDVIKTPSGKELGVTLLIQLLYVRCGTRYIAESQIIQDAIDHITIEYVPTENFTTYDLNNFTNRLTKNIDSELNFDMKKVNAVKRTKNGKIKPLISLIN